MLLQISVFIQPLLPEKYQISPVCVTISELKASVHSHLLHQPTSTTVDGVDIHAKSLQHQHHIDHHCIFCTVYGHLSTQIDTHFNTVLDQIQIRLIAFQRSFKHIYFVLQRLFLNPQGRAPPLFA